MKDKNNPRKKNQNTLHCINKHPHAFGTSKLATLSGRTIGGSMVVNIWGIDIPPEMTISEAHENKKAHTNFHLQTIQFLVARKEEKKSVIPIPSRTDRLGLRTSLGLIRIMSPR